MGIEHRAGRHYYYRKERQGRRVVSVYMGAGRRALIRAAADQAARADRAADQAAAAERLADLAATYAPIDALLADLATRARALTHAVLHANGYHQHKGQWRKRRER